MLEAILLAAIVAAPLGSAALFLPARRHRHDTGAWPPVRRFALALVGTVVVAALVAGVMRLLGPPSTTWSPLWPAWCSRA